MSLEAIANTKTVYTEPMKEAKKPEAAENKIESNTGTTGAISITQTKPTGEILKEKKEDNKDGKEEEQKKPVYSDKQIQTAIANVNEKAKIKRTGCEYTYHEKTKRISIKLYDKETQEVIREIPPEETLKMIEKLWEMAGLVVDERR